MLFGPRMSRMSSAGAVPAGADIGGVLAGIGAMLGAGPATADIGSATADVGKAIVGLGTAIAAVAKIPIATAPQVQGARLLLRRLIRAGARGF
jgi:phage shock protein PspC (stress-responsive transcriptional regulator)